MAKAKTNTRSSKAASAKKKSSSAKHRTSMSKKLEAQATTNKNLVDCIFVLGEEPRAKAKNEFRTSNLYNTIVSYSNKHPKTPCFVFATSEPKQIDGELKNVRAYNVVFSDKIPTYLALTTVQKAKVDVVSMESMGMNWAPANEIPGLGNVGEHVRILNCTKVRASKSIAFERALGFEQALLYVHPEEADKVEFASFEYTTSGGKTLDGTYEKGLGLNDYIEEMVEDHGLQPSEHELIEQTIREAFRNKRSEVQNTHEELSKLLSDEPSKADMQNSYIVKLYPDGIPTSNKCGTVCRYLGKDADVVL